MIAFSTQYLIPKKLRHLCPPLKSGEAPRGAVGSSYTNVTLRSAEHITASRNRSIQCSGRRQRQIYARGLQTHQHAQLVDPGLCQRLQASFLTSPCTHPCRTTGAKLPGRSYKLFRWLMRVGYTYDTMNVMEDLDETSCSAACSPLESFIYSSIELSNRSKSVQSTVSWVDSDAHRNKVLRGPKPGTVHSG